MKMKVDFLQTKEYTVYRSVKHERNDLHCLKTTFSNNSEDVKLQTQKLVKK